MPQNEINKIKAALEHEIDAAVTDGFTCFMSGFADGVDQYFAELVLERKQTNPALELDRSDPLPQASGQPEQENKNP